MLRNYLKMALRNYGRQKLHTTINILGLSIGLASAIFIFLYIDNELSFDTVFPAPDHTYRIGYKVTDKQGNINYNTTMPGGWAARMKSDLQDVVSDFRYIWIGYPTSLRVNNTDKILLTEELLWVDPGINKTMSFPMVEGNPDRALDDPNSMVVTRSAARKLFGDEDPMNKTVLLKHPFLTGTGEMTLKVTGVIDDYPENTHFHPKYLVNYASLKPYLQFGPSSSFEQWDQNMTFGPWGLYVRVRPGTSEAKIRDYLSKLKDEVITNNPDVQNRLNGSKVDVILRKVSDIHFDKDIQWENEGGSDKMYIYIFAGVAILIIAVAVINYMNLSTARSAKRAKEIGLRKALGSLRKQLFSQFMFESFLMVFIGFAGALLLVLIFLPIFNGIANKQIEFVEIFQWRLLLSLVVLLAGVGFVSGIYPSLFLSGFNPIEVLKGRFSFSKGSQIFRKSLTGFQFGIAVALLILTVIIVQQMDLLQNTRLNSNGDQVLSIRHGGIADYSRYPAFKNLVEQDPDLQAVTIANHLPRQDYFGGLQTAYKFPEVNDQEYDWDALNVDYDFPSIFDLQLVAGRFFEKGNLADSSAVLLNETAVKALGKTPADIIGTTVTAPRLDANYNYDYSNARNGRVIGVVKDFNYQSAYHAIQPLVLDPAPNSIDRIVYIKLPKGKFQEKIDFISKMWKQVYPGIGFDYWFVSDEFDRMYKAERRIAGLSRSFSALAILITCIGLFGLASFVAEQHTKEIGIRKAMGATNGEILVKLLMTFLRLLFIACVVALPLSYFASDKLLQNFVYRVPLGPLAGLLAVVIIAGLTILTVGYESLKASLVSPVKSLRYE